MHILLFSRWLLFLIGELDLKRETCWGLTSDPSTFLSSLLSQVRSVLSNDSCINTVDDDDRFLFSFSFFFLALGLWIYNYVADILLHLDTSGKNRQKKRKKKNQSVFAVLSFSHRLSVAYWIGRKSQSGMHLLMKMRELSSSNPLYSTEHTIVFLQV